VEGKLYLCSLLDARSARIVGYSIADRMTAQLAAVLERPRVTSVIEVLRRPVESGQFRSRKFVRVLNNNGLVGSMGRVSSAVDNAMMESFHALLQKNVLNSRRWETKDDLRLVMVTWIEITYNRRRRKRRLGRLSPVEFEVIDRALQVA
jgi:transposase InsO family protein